LRRRRGAVSDGPIRRSHSPLLLRFFSLLVLVLAVVSATVDAIQSVAADRLVMTPLGLAWRDVSPTTLGALEEWLAAALPGGIGIEALGALLAQPATAVLLALSFLLFLLGYRRRRRPRFSPR
jgi:hypothetical protein